MREISHVYKKLDRLRNRKISGQSFSFHDIGCSLKEGLKNSTVQNYLVTLSDDLARNAGVDTITKDFDNFDQALFSAINPKNLPSGWDAHLYNCDGTGAVVYDSDFTALTLNDPNSGLSRQILLTPPIEFAEFASSTGTNAPLESIDLYGINRLPGIEKYVASVPPNLQVNMSSFFDNPMTFTEFQRANDIGVGSKSNFFPLFGVYSYSVCARIRLNTCSNPFTGFVLFVSLAYESPVITNRAVVLPREPSTTLSTIGNGTNAVRIIGT